MKIPADLNLKFESLQQCAISKLNSKQLYYVLYNCQNTINTVSNLIADTLKLNHGNSCIIIGSYTLTNQVIEDSIECLHLNMEFNGLNQIWLHGAIHKDLDLACSEILCQLLHNYSYNIDEYPTYSQKLTLLAEIFALGRDNAHLIKHKNLHSLLVVLEELDAFVENSNNQSLLYILFDACQNSQIGVCVIATTSNVNALEYLEKRVKSRFSQRQYYLNPSPQFEPVYHTLRSILTLSRDEVADVDKEFRRKQYGDDLLTGWNKSIEVLFSQNDAWKLKLRQIFDFTSDLNILTNILTTAVSLAEPGPDHSGLSPEVLELAFAQQTMDCQKAVLKDLSILETILLMVALKIIHKQAGENGFNYDMVLQEIRSHKETDVFVKNIAEGIMTKAFEKLIMLELFTPLTTIGPSSSLTTWRQNSNNKFCGNSFSASGLQLRFKAFTSNIALSWDQILPQLDSIFPNLPTDINRWAKDKI